MSAEQPDEEDARLPRVRFFGPNDLAWGWHAPRVIQLALAFDPTKNWTKTSDVLELHNVRIYLEHGMMPDSIPEQDRARILSAVPKIKSAVARYFAQVNADNFSAVVANVDYEFHSDLLHLLGSSGAFRRIDATTMMHALAATGVHLATMISNKELVEAHDAEFRTVLLSSPEHAEFIVQKHLEKGDRRSIHLPRSLTSADAKGLLERYLDSERANLNYVRLIAKSRNNPAAGVDAKLRLRAKRRSEELNAEVFEDNVGIRTGCEVLVSDDQELPVVEELDKSDGLVWKYTYSRSWLEETLDNPSIFNNFQHLFAFVDDNALLTLPAYRAGMGVMERLIGVTGTSEYRTGNVFNMLDMRSMLQTEMYRRFLQSHDRELEDVVAWFCRGYLIEEFGIDGFTFSSSSAGAPFLQRIRHLFAEMESMVKQFSLYAENGEVDPELLSIGSEQVRYRDVPSLLDGKYVYPSDSSEIAGVLECLFSDQSTLTYIDENRKARNAATLIVRLRPKLSDFHEYQQPILKELIQLGILESVDTHLRFSSPDQLRVLAILFNTEAAAYHHLPAAARAQVDAMVARGWLVRRSTLLTSAEADYFNYFLNSVDFSNGPDLRNRYLHGSQETKEGETAHARAYAIALRITIALVIKINDDLCLSTL